MKFNFDLIQLSLGPIAINIKNGIKKGIIKIRHVGVLTPQVWNEKFSYLLNE